MSELEDDMSVRVHWFSWYEFCYWNLRAWNARERCEATRDKWLVVIPIYDTLRIE